MIPPRGEVNAADAFDIGSFDEEDTKGIKVHSFNGLGEDGPGSAALHFGCVHAIPSLHGLLTVQGIAFLET